MKDFTIVGNDLARVLRWGPGLYFDIVLIKDFTIVGNDLARVLRWGPGLYFDIVLIKIFTIVGNDLARVLRWGPGYSGGEDPLNLLRDVIDAEEIKLDR